MINALLRSELPFGRPDTENRADDLYDFTVRLDKPHKAGGQLIRNCLPEPIASKWPDDFTTAGTGAIPTKLRSLIIGITRA